MAGYHCISAANMEAVGCLVASEMMTIREFHEKLRIQPASGSDEPSCRSYAATCAHWRERIAAGRRKAMHHPRCAGEQLERLAVEHRSAPSGGRSNALEYA